MVLNRYREVETAEAMVESTGLVGIVGASSPPFAESLVHVLANQLSALTFAERIGDEELSRAKNMLKCNVLTCLESPHMVFEDIGQQLIFDDHYIPPVDICKMIDAVTAEDIARIARQAIVKGPAIASVGPHTQRVPTVDAVRSWFGMAPLSKEK